MKNWKALKKKNKILELKHIMTELKNLIKASKADLAMRKTKKEKESVTAKTGHLK